MSKESNKTSFKELLLISENSRKEKKVGKSHSQRCTDEHLFFMHELTKLPFRKIIRREKYRVALETIRTVKYRLALIALAFVMLFSVVSVSAGLFEHKEEQRTFVVQTIDCDEKNIVSVSINEKVRLEPFSGVDAREYYLGYLPDGYGLVGENERGKHYFSEKGDLYFKRSQIYSDITYVAEDVYAEIFLHGELEILYVKEGEFESYYFTDGYFLFCILSDLNNISRGEILKIIEGMKFE